MLLIAGLAGFLVIKGLRNPLMEGVRAMAGGHKYSPGGRGTDAIVQVQNTNDVPVDVTILAEGKDKLGNVMISETLRPVRSLGPGEVRTVKFQWSIAPLEAIDYTVVDVQPTAGAEEP